MASSAQVSTGFGFDKCAGEHRLCTFATLGRAAFLIHAVMHGGSATGIPTTALPPCNSCQHARRQFPTASCIGPSAGAGGCGVGGNGGGASAGENIMTPPHPAYCCCPTPCLLPPLIPTTISYKFVPQVRAVMFVPWAGKIRSARADCFGDPTDLLRTPRPSSIDIQVWRPW